MNVIKIVAAGLIISGVLGLAYGGFTYTKEKHEANVGPMQLSLNDRETVEIPVWVSVAAIVAGGAILLFGSKNR
ncbi:MAG: hypothetical protein K0R08_917 [Solimicrobium sp.]|jgi:TRAP-type C4-dicarboxylate transport system permease small subunit|nr:hypothetical protein [Solimicrobium sp.]